VLSEIHENDECNVGTQPAIYVPVVQALIDSIPKVPVDNPLNFCLAFSEIVYKLMGYLT